MAGSVPLPIVHLGRVTAFDDRRGLGTVTDADGVDYDFHATAIADGSRTIEPGTQVHYVVAAGLQGRDEARALTAVGSPAAGSSVG